MKVLIVRADRIGDLVLSTPVVFAIKQWHPDTHVGLICSAYAGEIIADLEGIDSLYRLREDRSNLREIVAEVKRESYTHSVTLFVDSVAARIPVRAGIPNRVGPYSKPRSLRLFNRGMIQKRSRSIKNEAEYNLDLLKKIGLDRKSILGESVRPRLNCTNLPRVQVPPKYAVVHPGMGGSALNIPKERYLEIVRALARDIPVVMTFGPMDSEDYEFFSQHLDPACLLRNLSLKESQYVYYHAKVFIGPSTGPMHIAAACGTKTFAVFSPLKAQSHTRWGPWGNDACIIVPQVECKERFSCNKDCPSFDCMLSIPADKVIQQVNAYLHSDETSTVGMHNLS